MLEFINIETNQTIKFMTDIRDIPNKDDTVIIDLQYYTVIHRQFNYYTDADGITQCGVGVFIKQSK
jgi:hypothetical protein